MGLPHFTPYALPALLTLLGKACIFYYAHHSRTHNLKTRVFLLFLFCLAVQNLSEISFFSAKAAGLPAPPGGLIYFASSIFALALFLHLALLMATDRPGQRSWGGGLAALIYAPALLLQALLWAGPSLIAGFSPQNYTYTKIAGPLYVLFEIYTLIYLGCAAALFVYGAYAQKTSFQRSQNKLLLVSLLPPAILVVAVVSLQRFGFTGFNTTTTLPVAMTFFLAVTAYATHQYRPFDIDFFLPWSSVRKRKTEFYRRIQATVGAITELRSVKEVTQLIADTLRCQLALVGGPQPITALARGQDGANLRLLSQFPLPALHQVREITVAHEIADHDPALYRLMERYRVGAIVPFRTYNHAAMHWLILGDHFGNEVYTPLDFKAVETLFTAMAERFLDDFLYIRAQLGRVQEQLDQKRVELGLAWHQEHEATRALELLREENRALHHQISCLRGLPGRQLPGGTDPGVPDRSPTLDEQLRESEKQAVIASLERTGGNRREAAEILGISADALGHLMQRHGIGTSDESYPT